MDQYLGLIHNSFMLNNVSYGFRSQTRTQILLGAEHLKKTFFFKQPQSCCHHHKEIRSDLSAILDEATLPSANFGCAAEEKRQIGE